MTDFGPPQLRVVTAASRKNLSGANMDELLQIVGATSLETANEEQCERLLKIIEEMPRRTTADARDRLGP